MRPALLDFLAVITIIARLGSRFSLTAHHLPDFIQNASRVWADALANRSLPDTVVPRKRDAASSANKREPQVIKKLPKTIQLRLLYRARDRPIPVVTTNQ